MSFLIKEKSAKTNDISSIAELSEMRRIPSVTTETCSSSRIKHGSNFNQRMDQLCRIGNESSNYNTMRNLGGQNVTNHHN